MLAAVYFRSFHDDVQKMAKPSIRDLTIKTFTHSKIRQIVSADENIDKLGDLTADRPKEGVALSTQQTYGRPDQRGRVEQRGRFEQRPREQRGQSTSQPRAHCG